MKERIGQLDGVRMVAIAMVFLGHAGDLRMMWMGVDLFFVLSGFLITGILISSRQRNLGAYIGHFYERRARRILPPYVLLLVVTSLLFGLGWARHWYLYLFLMNLLNPLKVDHPRSLVVLWSLAVEEQFYMVWPFVVFLLSEAGIAWTAGGIIVLSPILRLTCTSLFSDPYATYFLTPFRMDTLALGALLAIAWRHHRDKITKYGVYGPVFTVVSLGAWFAWLRLQPSFAAATNGSALRNMVQYDVALIACGGVIVWALSGRYVGVLTWAPARYLGRISYSVYLIHLTPLILLAPHFRGRLVPGLLAAILTLAYAALSWHFYERPILLGKPKSGTRREMEEEQRAAAAVCE